VGFAISDKTFIRSFSEKTLLDLLVR